jgi:hypothetical protein
MIANGSNTAYTGNRKGFENLRNNGSGVIRYALNFMDKSFYISIITDLKKNVTGFGFNFLYTG